MHSEIRGNYYAESTVYYLVFPFPDVHAVRLKTVDMRVIRQAFGLNPDRQKVDTFFSLHATEEMNGYFLKKLVEYLDE